MRGFCKHFNWKHSVLIFVGILYSILNCKSVFVGIVPYLAWIQKVNASNDIWHHILSYHLYSHKSPYDADRSDHVKDGDDPEKDEHPYRSVFHISVYLWHYSNMMKPWVAKLWPKIFDLVYVYRRRDGPYEVENCLYDVQDGENPYPDPEAEFYYEFREKVWWQISPPTTFIANELITAAIKAKRSDDMLKSNVCTLLNNTWCATLPTIGVEVNCWWGGAFYVARWTKQSPGAKIHNGPSPPLFLPPTHPQKTWKSITPWALCDLLPQLILNSRKGLCACTGWFF